MTNADAVSALLARLGRAISIDVLFLLSLLLLTCLSLLLSDVNSAVVVIFVAVIVVVVVFDVFIIVTPSDCGCCHRWVIEIACVIVIVNVIGVPDIAIVRSHCCSHSC